MRALFIGGPWDGRLIEHALKSTTMNVREHSPKFVNYNAAMEDTPRYPDFHEVTYVRFSMFGYDFMIEQRMFDRGRHYGKHPTEIVMDVLSQGYRRPSNIYGDI